MTGRWTLEYMERVGRGMIGLLVSAGYGALVGLRTGALVGCAVGTIVPVIGNICGFFIGAVVGTLVGAPAGILCGTLQGRNGCRASGAIGALLVPLGYALANSEWSAALGRDAWLILVILAAFATVGTIAGNWVWRKLEDEPPGMFATWGKQNERWGLYRLSLADRLLSALLLILPALVFYLTRG